MKSSSNIIRSENNNNEIKSWIPVEFEEDNDFSGEFIAANTDRFFSIKESVNRKIETKVIHADEAIEQFKPWKPAEMKEVKVTPVSDVATQNWTPFLEKPNPRKIADKMISDTRLECELILEQVNKEAEVIKQNAFNQGLEEAKREMSETLKAAASVINVAREWRSDMMAQAEPMIMDLVKKMAQKMFGDGLVLDNVHLQQHFSEILESARSLGDLRIFMNPEDVKVLGPDWREYQSSIIGNEVEIVTNESIKRGGCYVQGEWGTADALVETQLNAILEQFSEVESPEIGDD